MSTDKGADYICEEPCGRDRRASEIEYLFPVSFPLVGNPSDCSRSQERFWTSQNDRNKELRQRPQGVKFIKRGRNDREIREGILQDLSCTCSGPEFSWYFSYIFLLHPSRKGLQQGREHSCPDGR